MKTPIAVTLIIMGALLVMTPVISDFFYQRNVVALLNRSGVTQVTLRNQMTAYYRFGCWLTGTGMIGVAVFGSGFARTRRAEHESLATHPA
jgi:hypothetical protein